MLRSQSIRNWHYMMTLETAPSPENKKFGFCLKTVPLLPAIYCLVLYRMTCSFVSVAISSIVFMSTIGKDALFHRFDKAWLDFGKLLGKIISIIILGLIYFGFFFLVVSTSGLRGRDKLHLNLQNNGSCWGKRYLYL